MRASILATLCLLALPLRSAHAKGDDVAAVLAECLDKGDEKVCAKACTLGSGRGCFEAGAYAYEADKPELKKKALGLFDKGCKLGEVLACSNLGVMLVRGVGGPVDYARGNKILADACEKNDAIGCAELGNSYNTGRGMPANPAKFVEAERRACKLGSNPACSALDSNGLSRE